MVELQKNEIIQLISDNFEKVSPNWTKVTQIFKQTQKFQYRNYDIYNLASYLSEIHMRIVINNICEEYNVSNKFLSKPIKNFSITENYNFTYQDDNLLVSRRKKGNTYCEIDHLAIVDGLPVIFEIKLTRYKRCRRKSKSPGSRGLHHAMKKKRIRHLLKPFREYFNTNEIGYVLIINPENIKKNSSVQKKFLKRNGVIVPFYTTRRRYISEIRDIKNIYNL